MSLDAKKIARQLAKAYQKYGSISFFVIVSIGLGVAILMLLSIVSSSSRPVDESKELIDDSFDTETIERIRNLRQDQLAEPGPRDRSNPFQE